MNQSTHQKTIRCAALIDAMQPMLVETLDGLQPEYGPTSVVRRYEPEVTPDDPWIGKEYKGHNLTSNCLAKLRDADVSLRCVVSDEGYVRLYGDGGKPEGVYQIEDAGVWRKGAAGYGYVHRIRQLGRTIYVCGDSRQVYRFVVPGNASDAPGMLKRGRFVHMDTGMLQPAMPEHPGRQATGAQEERWLDNTESCPFWDIGGPGESDIYAVGDEAWHWNGKEWQQLELPNDGETLFAVKVIDADHIVLVGANGYVLVGNAQAGFTNVSSVDDNQNFTGIEWFMDRLWLASNVGLYVFDPRNQCIEKYTTDLQPDLQDTHLVEAKDGVLWSFGHKDLAYLDSRDGNNTWVRVHHPDNPRIGTATARPARQHTGAQAADAVAIAQATGAALAWLPARPFEPGEIDIGGLISRVGHRGVGRFVSEQLAACGMQPADLFKVNRSQRYTVTVPMQGLTLTLQYTGPKKPAAAPENHPEHWALAEVTLLAPQPGAPSGWGGPWPGDLSPSGPDVLNQARTIWGEEDASDDTQASFFVDGVQGAAWVVNLGLMPAGGGLKHLKILHLGDYTDLSTNVG